MADGVLRATSSSRAGRPQAGDGAAVAAAAPRAGLGIARSAATSCSTAAPSCRGEQNPADFDGEPLRPYNVQPDALLLNYKSVVMTFVPDSGARHRQHQLRPAAGRRADAGQRAARPPGPLRRLARRRSRPTSPTRCACAFAGSYPAACGEKVWPIAYPDPASYAQRAIAGLWQEMGGKLRRRVRDGVAPAGEAELRAGLAAAGRGDPRHQQVQQQRDGAAAVPDARPAAPGRRRQRGVARGGARGGWRPLWRGGERPVLDNGSGLSRMARITPQGWRACCRRPGRAPMPELMARCRSPASMARCAARRASPGRAHLKTGTLRDVIGVAGYVLADRGRR